VLQCLDPHLQREVAIKILDPQLANNKDMRQRFCREARAAAAVSHENIVAVYQVDEDSRSGLPFLVMQLVHGESLEQRLRRVGKLSPIEVARIGLQAAAGLTSAHANGLIHRDIKPGNILLETATEKVRLTDFGLARVADDIRITRTGFVAGTPLYMAPEQARGDEIDARADLFSLGSVMYEALTGIPAFDGKSPLMVLRRVADETPVPLTKLNPAVPLWLEDVIESLLAKNRNDRFQKASDVAEILAVHLQDAGALDVVADPCQLSRSSTRLRRKRWRVCWKHFTLLLGLFTAGLAVGGFSVWMLASTHPVPEMANPANRVPNTHTLPLLVDPGPIPKAVLPARSGAIWSVALSKDGRTMVMGIENGRISLWDVNSQRLKFDFHPEKNDQAPAHKGPVWALEFTPDEKTIVSASDDGTIKVWDVVSGKQLKSIPAGAPVRAAAVSPSGAWVAIGDRFGDVSVFDLATESVLLQYKQESTVNGVAFSPDNLTVASVSTDGTVVLWEVAGKRKRFALTGHTGPVYGLAFSPDGRQLATASWDQSVIIWDINTGTQIRSFIAHDEGVWAIEYSPDGKILATAGQDGTTKIWNATTSKEIARFGKHKGTVHTIQFDADGHLLATGGRDGTVRIWDLSQYFR
ncbi:MAG: serine/threonine protein kinase, partial [Bacteroidales bacterium]|nr:serine/threonine protein kinase [Bacteroidales bacterium]